MNLKEQAKAEVIAAVDKLAVQYEKDIKAAAKAIIERLQEQSINMGGVGGYDYNIVSIDAVKKVITDKLDTQFNIEL